MKMCRHPIGMPNQHWSEYHVFEMCAYVFVSPVPRVFRVSRVQVMRLKQFFFFIFFFQSRLQ